MRLHPLLAIAGLMLYALSGNAQSLTIEGEITDTKTKEPLPYVHLRVVGQNSGTQTNLDGRYLLRYSPTDERVAVSLAGYRTDTITLAKLRKHPKIKLRPLEINLQAVTVSDFTKPSALLKEVVRRIPENYHTDTTVGTFFYRRYGLTSDSLWLFCEAMADVMRPGYDKQYHLSSGMIIIDKDGSRDSIALAGNHKRYTASSLDVYDTTMLRRMLGDTNYEQCPVVGRTQTEYSEQYAFNDMLQDVASDRWLSGKRSRRLDRRARLTTYDDAQGHSFYLITSVTERDSTALVVDYRDKALIHYYHTSLRPDSVMMPFPLNRILGGVYCPYSRTQYDYTKVGGRYTLSFAMQAVAYSLIPPKKAWFGGSLNRMARQLITRDVVEDYKVWTLVDLRKADHRFIDTALHVGRNQQLYYHDIFGVEEADPTLWQQYNTVPVEARIVQKLKAKKR